MVTSLEMAVMQWVIAYLNQALPVKEQRVDGSSDSRNLDFVRYTLVAGKPVFGRKIHFHRDSRKVVKWLMGRHSRAFIHTTRSMHNLESLTSLRSKEREQVNNISTLVKPTALNITKLDPWFVTGFVDAL